MSDVAAATPPPSPAKAKVKRGKPASAAAAKRKLANIRTVRRAKGNQLVPVTFSRGFKSLFDDDETKLDYTTRVTASGNKKIDLVARDLMSELLTKSKMLLFASKKEQLNVDTLHRVFKIMIPNDTMGIVEGAHAFALARVEQYRASLMTVARTAEEEKEDAINEEEEEQEQEEEEEEEEKKKDPDFEMGEEEEEEESEEDKKANAAVYKKAAKAAKAAKAKAKAAAKEAEDGEEGEEENA